jgi:glycogen synthase
VRVLFVSNLYPPNVVGGYERLCFQVAAALVDRGHEVFVLTSDFGGQHRAYEGQTVRRRLRLATDSTDIYRPFEASEDERAAIHRSNVDAFNHMVRDCEPDLVFCWNLYFLDRSLLEAVSRCGVPAALFLTDNWLIAAQTPERIHEHFARHVQGSQPFVPRVGVADQYVGMTAIFGSAFVQDLYLSCGYEFAGRMIVHNGVTPPNQDPGLAPDRTKTFALDSCRLLFAGRFVDLKGPQDCVAALPAIQRLLGPDVEVRLTLVGDMQDQRFCDTLRDQITATGMADRITMQDAVSEGDLIDLFNTHDIYLFPSHYEPFALTLILAMACGIPVVGSQVGGNPEILLDLRTGLTHPKGDINAMAAHVVALYQDPELRSGLAARGRRFARRFTFARMIDQLENVLLAQIPDTIPHKAAKLVAGSPVTV